MDNNEVSSSSKICVTSECPDGKVSRPVCDEKIMVPLATVTPILVVLVLIWISVRAEMSRTAMYVPDAPESALNFLETEEFAFPYTVGSLFSGIYETIAVRALGQLLLLLLVLFSI